jgi:tetratricopeptide (TPR) repeat protein
MQHEMGVQTIQKSNRTDIVGRMPFDQVFERYLDGLASQEAGLSTTAMYVFEDALAKADAYQLINSEYHPQHTSILELLGSCYLNNKRETDAFALLSRAMEMEPDNIRILYRLFNYHLTTSPNEKAALAIFLRAESTMNDLKRKHKDMSIFKMFEAKGLALKKKRNTDSILQEENVDKQNMMKQLPLEIIYTVMSHLDERSLQKLLSICKGWRSTILESPLLIGAYRINGRLTVEKLQRYLRLFDQKVSTSDIVVEALNLEMNYPATDAKLTKLLLAARLRTKQMRLQGGVEFYQTIPKMIKDSKSRVFSDLMELSLDVHDKDLTFDTISSVLGLTNRLRVLCLRITRISPQIKGTSKTVALNELHRLSIHFNGTDMIPAAEAFFQSLDYPNLQSVIFMGGVPSGLKVALNKVNNLKSLKLCSYSAPKFVTQYLLRGNADFDMIKNIEKLEIVGQLSQSQINTIDATILASAELPVFNKLKTLVFKDINVTCTVLEIFLDTCKNTLRNLYILGITSIEYMSHTTNPMGTIPRTNRAAFNVKYILQTAPRLTRFRFTDKQMGLNEFTQAMFEIATLTKPIKLELFEFSNDKLKAQDHVLQFLSIKDKLTIKHVRVRCSIVDPLKTFVDMAVASGQVKSVESIRDTRGVIDEIDI